MKSIGGDMREPLKWYEENADNPALDQGSGGGSAVSSARRLALSPRPGNHRVY